MSTFKTALRMALAHPFYLLIYTVFISLMGVFIAASVSWNSSQLTDAAMNTPMSEMNTV